MGLKRRPDKPTSNSAEYHPVPDPYRLYHPAPGSGAKVVISIDDVKSLIGLNRHFANALMVGYRSASLYWMKVVVALGKRNSIWSEQIE